MHYNIVMDNEDDDCPYACLTLSDATKKLEDRMEDASAPFILRAEITHKYVPKPSQFDIKEVDI
jgi:hypothetical protein